MFFRRMFAPQVRDAVIPRYRHMVMLQQLLDSIRILNIGHMTLAEAYEALEEGEVPVPSEEISPTDLKKLCMWLRTFVKNPQFANCLSANVVTFVEGRKQISDSGDHSRIRPINPANVLAVDSNAGTDYY